MLLSVAAVCLTAGVVNTGFPHGAALAGVCSVFLTLPVAFARRAPLGAAVIIMLAAAGNVLIARRMVRCGVALPAAFWIAFMLGYRARGRRTLAGLAVVFAALAVQACTDPAIDPEILVAIVPVAGGFFAAGDACRTRNEAIQQLTERNRELAPHARERAAALAVQMDRLRIGGELAPPVQRGLADMTEASRQAVAEFDTDPVAAAAAMHDVTRLGREVLAQMREVVGLLDFRASTGPSTPGTSDGPPGPRRPTVGSITTESPLRGAARGTKIDLALSAGFVAGAVVIVGALHDISIETAFAGVFVIGGAGLSYLMQRRHPLAGSVMAAVFLFAMSAVNQHDALDAVQGFGMVLCCLIGFRLGRSTGWRPGMPLAIILVAALQAGDPVFNPIYEMMILGPWAAGQLLRSRSSVLDELAARSADLRRERELLAAEGYPPRAGPNRPGLTMSWPITSASLSSKPTRPCGSLRNSRRGRRRCWRPSPRCAGRPNPR